MKKISSIVLFISLFISCSPRINPYFGYKSIGYNNKLSKATWNAYKTKKINGEWIKGDLDWVYIVRFNESGNVIEASTYNERDELESKNTLSYLENNKVKSSFYDPEGNQTGQRFFELESNNRYNFKDSDSVNTLSGYIIFSNKLSKGYRWVKEYRVVDEHSILEYESLTEVKSRYKKYYDENQNLVYETRNDFLEFNDYGDWTKALRFDEGEDGTDVQIIIRTLEYSD